MPHVIVKLWPGKSEKQKHELAEAITENVCKVLHYGQESVSVAMEEIAPADWKHIVYRQDIMKNSKNLYKKPGYTEADL